MWCLQCQLQSIAVKLVLLMLCFTLSKQMDVLLAIALSLLLKTGWTQNIFPGLMATKWNTNFDTAMSV